MKVGFIGCGFKDLNYEVFGEGPYCEQLSTTLEKLVDSLVDMEGSIVSLNPGADFIWAWCVLNKGISLTIYNSYDDPSQYWTQFTKDIREEIVMNKGCRELTISVGKFEPHKDKIRDIHMVNDCDMLICVLPSLLDRERFDDMILRMREKDKEVIIIESVDIAKKAKLIK